MQLTRRRFLVVSASLTVAGCTRGGRGGKNAVATWGGPDVRDGNFRKPRAVAAQDGEVYVVDTTGRVQVFSQDGQFLRKWSTPAYENGTPTAISFAVDGQVLIPDTHYSQILKYTRDGQLLDRWGQYGTGPDQFIYPTDIVQSPDGTYFISEYGMEAERIHVFDAE